MGVPFIDIKRFEPGFLDSWEKKVAEMSKNTAFIGGPEVSALEASMIKENQVKYAISCANGTDAIQLALRAVGVGVDDKVVIPDSTFWATFEAVVNCGASPVTVDTNPEDLQMDFDEFEKAIDEIKPKAAIIVHLYGWGSSRLADFRELCKKKNIPLIEDGAQSYGVKYKGESIYKGAYVSTVSFYPAKVLGAAGDAGSVITNDEELANKIRVLSNHGRISHYEYGLVGWNSRMDSFQAAFLNLSLANFPARLKSRIDAAERYIKELPGIGVNVVSPPKDYGQNGYCNVTLFENAKREKLIEHLKSKGIGYGIIYPGAMSDQPGAKGVLIKRFGKHKTGELCASILNLPLFAYMKPEEIDEVILAVKEFQKGYWKN